MSRIARIDLAYDGTAFHGWQIQPGKRTVQGDISREVSRLLGREVQATGAGRTDAGVHALGQVAHVGEVSAEEIARLRRALARATPADIEVLAVSEAAEEFDARFSAIWRRYEYHLRFGRDIFRRNQEWQIYWRLDRTSMDRAAELFLGRHDFSSFCKATSLKPDNHCEVLDCRFEWRKESATFHIRANRFLHHMVRTLVGTLNEVGLGQRGPKDMTEIIAARERSAAGKMAPAHGLYLAEVGYPDTASDAQYGRSEQPAEETE